MFTFLSAYKRAAFPKTAIGPFLAFTSHIFHVRSIPKVAKIFVKNNKTRVSGERPVVSVGLIHVILL